MKAEEQQSADLDQTTILSRQTVIRGGSFEVGHDVTIRGTLEGRVTVGGRIDVLHGAEVDGSVHAREAVIAGTVRGNLTVDGMLILRSTAVVEGEIRAGAIAVEEGATGGISIAAGSGAASETADVRRRGSRRELGEALARARSAVSAATGEPAVAQEMVKREQWSRETASVAVESKRPEQERSTERMLSSPEIQDFYRGTATPEQTPPGLAISRSREEADR